MGNSLYPTFDLPTIADPGTTSDQKKYKPSIKFDYDLGDFVRDGANRLVVCDGKEAWLQWCMKVVVTERNTKRAYSDQIGTEMADALKQSDIAAVESAIERTYTEALMVNPLTEYVRNFTFEWSGSDSLTVSFIVKGQQWEEQNLSVSY